MATYSTIGSTILSFALTAFLYYFFWVAVLPFMRIEKGIPPFTLMTVCCCVFIDSEIGVHLLLTPAKYCALHLLSQDVTHRHQKRQHNNSSTCRYTYTQMQKHMVTHATNSHRICCYRYIRTANTLNVDEIASQTEKRNDLNN